MCQHTESEYPVVKAEISGCSRVVAVVVVQNQQPPLASKMLCVFVEMLDPFQAKPSLSLLPPCSLTAIHPGPQIMFLGRII